MGLILQRGGFKGEHDLAPKETAKWNGFAPEQGQTG